MWDAPGLSAAKALRLALPAPLLAWFEGVKDFLSKLLNLLCSSGNIWEPDYKRLQMWRQRVPDGFFSEAILYLFQLQLAFMQIACSLVNSVVIRTRHTMSTWPCFQSSASTKEIGDATTNTVLSISQKFIRFLRIQSSASDVQLTYWQRGKKSSTCRSKKCPSFMSPKKVLKFAVKTSRTFSTIGPCRSQANSMRQKEIHHRRNQLLKSWNVRGHEYRTSPFGFRWC